MHVVLHVYRHRLLYSHVNSEYEEIERQLLTQPKIKVPAVTLDVVVDGNFPATNGTPSPQYSVGRRVHRFVEGAGHNLTGEKPQAFIDAVAEVLMLK